MSPIAMLLCASVVGLIVLLGVAYRQSCVNAGYALPLAAFLKGVTWQSSNCGGNSAALYQCEKLVRTAAVQASEYGGTFDLNSLREIDRAEIVAHWQNHWVSGASFWIRTNFVPYSSPREIVAFCDTAFDNVPQPTFWNAHRRNPAQAVAYSDCTRGLLSPAQFKNLDRSAFASLKDMATDRLENSSPQ